MKVLLIAALSGFAVSGASAQASAEVRINHAVVSFTTPTGATGTQTFENLVFRTEFTSPTNVNSLYRELFAIQVPSGGSVSASYDYTLSVSDSGREIPFVGSPACTPLIVTTCFYPGNREMAFAQLLVGYRDPRTINPFIPGFDDEALLQTIADDKPDHMTQSGTLFAGFGNTLPGPATISFAVLAFGGAYTQPVPEPSTAALLLVSLAPLLRRLTRERSAARAGSLR